MTKDNNIIEVTCEKWVEVEQTDCRKCGHCEDMIFSDMVVIKARLSVSGKQIGDVIDVISFCSSCAGEITPSLQ